ncbi:hypothetical protein WMY93_002617 [Mugilogobius chulae]|uniref:Uncharacterized protein n=1 Tax=Mugilogobius chulae TaxID=88201 RepID=A0AAW0Q9J3_9GOBI
MSSSEREIDDWWKYRASKKIKPKMQRFMSIRPTSSEDAYKADKLWKQKKKLTAEVDTLESELKQEKFATTEVQGQLERQESENMESVVGELSGRAGADIQEERTTSKDCNKEKFRPTGATGMRTWSL